MIGPPVDAPKAADSRGAEDEFGERPLGYAQFNSFAVEEGGGEGFAVGVEGDWEGNTGVDGFDRFSMFLTFINYIKSRQLILIGPGQLNELRFALMIPPHSDELNP